MERFTNLRVILAPYDIRYSLLKWNKLERNGTSPAYNLSAACDWLTLCCWLRAQSAGCCCVDK